MISNDFKFIWNLKSKYYGYKWNNIEDTKKRLGQKKILIHQNDKILFKWIIINKCFFKFIIKINIYYYIFQYINVLFHSVISILKFWIKLLLLLVNFLVRIKFEIISIKIKIYNIT